MSEINKNISLDKFIQKLRNDDCIINYINLNEIRLLDIIRSDVSKCQALAEAIQNNIVVFTLDYQNKKRRIFSRSDINILANLVVNILEKNKSIKHLHFSGISFYDDSQIKNIAKALEKNNTLETLTLKNFQKGIFQKSVKGIRYLSQALLKNKTLKRLYYDSPNMGSLGTKYISRALWENHTLTKLTLVNNHITVKGCQYLLEALKKNNTLTHLSLIRNNIDLEGCYYLGMALKINKTLTSLRISDNIICDQACRNLFENLMENNTLVKLDLGGNPITTESCLYILKTLNVNYTLNNICLEDCDILYRNKDVERLDLIRNLLHRNKKIQFIKVNNQKIINLFYCLELKNIFIPRELKMIIWEKLISLFVY